MPNAAQIIAIADREVGYVERPINRTKYGAWYGMDGAAWCAMFTSWCFAQAGASPLTAASTAKGFAYTPAGADWFGRQGRWGQTPRVGALVFFDFPDSVRRIQHLGLVAAVGRGSIDTIEGNTSSGSGGNQSNGGGVWRRRRSASIVGYGYPAYDGAGVSEASGGGGGQPTLRRGSRGPAVADLQRRLGVAADGDFGPRTDAAVRSFQAARGLVVDGEVGPKTWGALGAPAPPAPSAPAASGRPTLRRGATGDVVRQLQDRLRAAGHDPGRTDGDFGPRTDAAVRAFQAARGLVVDGDVGPKTWGALG